MLERADTKHGHVIVSDTFFDHHGTERPEVSQEPDTIWCQVKFGMAVHDFHFDDYQEAEQFSAMLQHMATTVRDRINARRKGEG